LKEEPEGSDPSVRSRCRFLDIIKMHLKGIGLTCDDYVSTAHGRDTWWALVNAQINLSVFLKCGDIF
jgi:hypothetical protein